MFYLNPLYEADFWQQGFRKVDDFLVCSDGVAVGRHASRHVRRIPLGDFQIYLKREEPVQLKDRFESWMSGFGWCSKARREWQVLVKLREHGLPCPEPLAVGEIGNLAFLVVRGFTDSCDLPTYLAFRPSPEERHKVLRNLGHAIADLHRAGFTHPDLYAKHVFVHRPTLNVSFVDYQRTCMVKNISMPSRCRELARLDATLHPGAVPAKERLTFLHAYLHRAFGQVQSRQVKQAAQLVSVEANRLLHRRRIHAMYAETALLSGNVSVVTYCRVRVPDQADRITQNEPPVPLRRNRI
ncbi:MAG TPA: lipopolysaccharide kinase InaA family protein [Gemmatales bacterium]|nr:lipopolysaccharide kinase InaA family protein [Gemmatales bacterium]